MPPDYISPIIGIPIALFLWTLLFSIVFYQPVKVRIDDFFAMRRHKRRERKRQQAIEAMRKYVTMDAQMITQLYRNNQPKPYSGNSRQRGRHRQPTR